jgi:hypothetical protein
VFWVEPKVFDAARTGGPGLRSRLQRLLGLFNVKEAGVSFFSLGTSVLAFGGAIPRIAEEMPLLTSA